MDHAVQAATQAQVELVAMTLEQREPSLRIRRVSATVRKTFPALSPRRDGKRLKTKFRSTELRPTLRRALKIWKLNLGRRSRSHAVEIFGVVGQWRLYASRADDGKQRHLRRFSGQFKRSLMCILGQEVSMHAVRLLSLLCRLGAPQPLTAV